MWKARIRIHIHHAAQNAIDRERAGIDENGLADHDSFEWLQFNT